MVEIATIGGALVMRLVSVLSKPVFVMLETPSLGIVLPATVVVMATAVAELEIPSSIMVFEFLEEEVSDFTVLASNMLELVSFSLRLAPATEVLIDMDSPLFVETASVFAFVRTVVIPCDEAAAVVVELYSSRSDAVALITLLNESEFAFFKATPGVTAAIEIDSVSLVKELKSVKAVRLLLVMVCNVFRELLLLDTEPELLSMLFVIIPDEFEVVLNREASAEVAFNQGLEAKVEL